MDSALTWWPGGGCGWQACDNLLDEVDPEYIPFLQTFNCWRRFQDVRRFALAKRCGPSTPRPLALLGGRANGGGSHQDLG